MQDGLCGTPSRQRGCHVIGERACGLYQFPEMVFELSSSSSNFPAPPVQARLRTTYRKHKCQTAPGIDQGRSTRREAKEAYCALPPAVLLRFASLADGYQGVRNRGIFWAARQLSSKPLG
jgi:hypothetical protein